MPFVADDDRATNTQDNIRILSVIGHVDHGKRTLVDCLTVTPQHARHFVSHGMRTTAISLNAEDCDIFIVDFCGNVDFSPDIPLEMTISDGALIVMDCVEGVCLQTELRLAQALMKRLKPIVFMNKLDRVILELQLDPEAAYQLLVDTVEKTNTAITACNSGSSSAGDFRVSPAKGTLVFGSALQRWAFSLSSFAQIYAVKFGVDEVKMRERLWGDMFYDGKSHRWIHTERNEDGERVKRGFCQFCLDPIYQIFDVIMSDKKDDRLDKMLKAINVVLTIEEHAQNPKCLLKTVMMKFLPATDTILPMIVNQLPSPKKAQLYRAELLCKDTDAYYTGIKNCDAKAPLLMYVSKMMPTTTERGCFFAFGRIFAGTLRHGQKIRVLGATTRDDERAVLETSTKGDILCGNLSVVHINGDGWRMLPTTAAATIIDDVDGPVHFFV